MLEAVCCRAEACCSVRDDRSTLPAAISRAPTSIDSAPVRTELTVRAKLPCMFLSAENKRPVSVLSLTTIAADKSPAAILSKWVTARSSGLTILRVNITRTASANNTAAPTPTRIRVEMIEARC